MNKLNGVSVDLDELPIKDICWKIVEFLVSHNSDYLRLETKDEKICKSCQQIIQSVNQSIEKIIGKKRNIGLSYDNYLFKNTKSMPRFIPQTIEAVKAIIPIWFKQAKTNSDKTTHLIVFKESFGYEYIPLVDNWYHSHGIKDSKETVGSLLKKDIREINQFR